MLCLSSLQGWAASSEEDKKRVRPLWHILHPFMDGSP